MKSPLSNRRTNCRKDKVEQLLPLASTGQFSHSRCPWCADMQPAEKMEQTFPDQVRNIAAPMYLFYS